MVGTLDRKSFEHKSFESRTFVPKELGELDFFHPILEKVQSFYALERAEDILSSQKIILY